MLALVYAYSHTVSRSVVSANLVAEIAIDEIPEDQEDFAVQHGGDFIEILYPEYAR